MNVVKNCINKFQIKRHSKTSSSIRAFVDYDVDRTGVEA